MKPCEKYLYRWFYKDIAPPDKLDDSIDAEKLMNDQRVEGDGFIYTDGTLRFDNSVSILTDRNNDLQTAITPVVQRIDTAPINTPKLLSYTNQQTYPIDNDFDESLDDFVQQNDDNLMKDNSNLNITIPHTSETALYYNDHQMKIFEQLRLCTCPRHNCTVMMSAINYDDEPLVEWIIRQTIECPDIDIENIYGDTALIIASRLGKSRMVEMLVQHGADINKESTNGRTGEFLNDN